MALETVELLTEMTLLEATTLLEGMTLLDGATLLEDVSRTLAEELAATDEVVLVKTDDGVGEARPEDD